MCADIFKCKQFEQFYKTLLTNKKQKQQKQNNSQKNNENILFKMKTISTDCKQKTAGGNHLKYLA